MNEAGIAITLLAGAGGVISYLFLQLMAAKDRDHARALADLESAKKVIEGDKKSYQEIAEEAVKSALEMTNFQRIKDGRPPLVPLVPVIPESHSPSTVQQRETADIQTMRATMAAVKLATNQDPRPEPERAIEVE